MSLMRNTSGDSAGVRADGAAVTGREQGARGATRKLLQKGQLDGGQMRQRDGNGKGGTSNIGGLSRSRFSHIALDRP